MSELVAQFSATTTGALAPILADGSEMMVVVGIVLAAFIAFVVFTAARRAGEQEQEHAPGSEAGEELGGTDSSAEHDAGEGGATSSPPAGAGANPNKGLASVFGLSGPSVQPPPEEQRAAKLGEPEQFGAVRESLVAVLDDMDATDAQFVVPDMALQRDPGLEAEQISRLLTDLGNRLGAAVTPEIQAKATGEDDMELRELIARLTGTFEEEQEAKEGEQAER